MRNCSIDIAHSTSHERAVAGLYRHEDGKNENTR
jgi:hypothetical protein